MLACYKIISWLSFSLHQNAAYSNRLEGESDLGICRMLYIQARETESSIPDIAINMQNNLSLFTFMESLRPFDGES